MARSILKPTLKAMRAIIAAARELGDDATWEKLVEATGYDLQLIKQVMRNKPRIKQKLLVNPPAPLPTMPKWVAEIMKMPERARPVAPMAQRPILRPWDLVI